MNNLPMRNTASLIQGFWFIFNDAENTIIARASSATGKEYIYVNGKIFSEKRSVKTISEHEFVYGGKKYKIIFNVMSILTGKIECTLFINGDLAKTYKVFFKFRIVKFIFCLIIGALSGITGTYFGLSFGSIAPFTLLILFTFLLLFQPSKDFTFEEDKA